MTDTHTTADIHQEKVFEAHTAKHQTAVVFHHHRPPAKETHHGSADSDPELRRRKI
ncbi:hypothetical protein [Lacimonas salitolerans]|uniref:Uncharacterized protein n=1 Tax=Lacimonas salitolerans TaxID=1323750 RepID=A0ABW4EBC9_9RHOB